ncbi:MAG: ZrgA family zinc uptake protein, partial [Octadecabacter sp.]
PGADIVGFEYAAESDADLAAIDAGLATLSAPLDLFVMPDAAACTLVTADVELEGGEAHEDHDDHDDHADEDHDDHEHDEDHADEDHDEHEHDEDHADEDHDEHEHDEDHAAEDHDEHEQAAGHTAFHADYTLTCENPDALTDITFAYFETFPNALEVEVQLVTASGAQAFEVERDEPVLNLE